MGEEHIDFVKLFDGASIVHVYDPVSEPGPLLQVFLKSLLLGVYHH